jgi:molybdate transport system regulatory protein
MQIDGRFWLSKDGMSFLGAGRIELLERIEQSGSINAAAKEMKMSYKAAWERINGMNALADEPLIERKAGGKGGGGSHLTPYAHELIKTYHRFAELHREFINKFSEAAGNPERLARILSRTFLTTSARNQLHATIRSLEKNELHSLLHLELDGGVRMVSKITTKSVRDMGLEEGSEVYAIIKSSDIQIDNEPPHAMDNRNILEGAIKKIEIAQESVEITFALSDSLSLTAMVPKSSVSNLFIGAKAYASFQTNNIIIGM